MKKTDIAMIILIAAISMLVAFLVTRSIMGGSAVEEQKVDSIIKISPDIAQPSSDIFNSQAINPAVEVQIKPDGQ